MKNGIPEAIKNEFIIISDNIKYPTYLDEEFQKSISEDKKLNNYSEENTKKAFDDFFQIYQSCRDKVYNIISNNLHNFQEYCTNIKEKSINFVFYFNLFERFAKLLEAKYYNKPIKQNKEIFSDDIIYDCISKDKNFSLLYKKDYNEKNGLNKVNQELNPVVEKYNKIMRSKNKLGNIIIITFKYLTKYLFAPFEQELIKFLNIKIFFENDFFKTNNNEENGIIMLNVILFLRKMKILEYTFYNSALVKKNDICNLEEKSKEWIELKKVLFRLIPENSEELKNRNLEINKNADLFVSVMSNISFNNNESESATSLIYSGIKNLIYYKSYDTKAKFDSKMFQIKSKFEDLPKFIKLFKTVKPIFTTIIPSVPFRRKIYVKKELTPITRSIIEKLINFMKGEDSPVDSSIAKNTQKDNNQNMTLPLLYKDKVPDKKIKRNYVSITILNNKTLYFKDEREESIISSIINKFKSNTINTQINNEFKKNTILIAIHGGGFIASSTLIHERYLRKWLKEIDIPIFGINYSLAPEYRYPEGVNDVFQAYMWILNHAKEELNMDIKHIILYGDSAGGNIIIALNSLLIVLKEYDKNLRNRIVLPELLLLSYPVTHVSVDNYSNSILLSLDSQMWNTNVIKYMCQQYLGNYPLQEKDLFLNPIKLNDFILDRMTGKIRFFFGSNDILRDDSIKLLHAFSKYNNKNRTNKIDARAYDILYLGHGFNGQSENIQKISRSVIVPEINEFLKNII